MSLEARIHALLNDPEVQAGARRKRQLRALGQFLRSIREARNLSQIQLAARIQLTQPAVHRLETGAGGNGPDFCSVLRYLEACNAKLVLKWEHAADAESVEFVHHVVDRRISREEEDRLYGIGTVRQSLDIESG